MEKIIAERPKNTLLNIVTQLENLLDYVENEDEINEIVEREFESLATDLNEKAYNYTAIMERWESEKALYKKIEDEYKTKRKRIEKAENRLKGLFILCMKKINTTKVSHKGRTVSIVKNKPSMKIDNVELLPDEYKYAEMVTQIYKDKLKASLEAGEAIEGAHLEGGEHIRWR